MIDLQAEILKQYDNTLKALKGNDKELNEMLSESVNCPNCERLTTIEDIITDDDGFDDVPKCSMCTY